MDHDDEGIPPTEDGDRVLTPISGSYRSEWSSSGLRTHALKCVNTLSGHHSGIRVIAVHHNRVFTGSYDNTIKVWNLDCGSCEATLEGHVAWIRSLFCHTRDPLLFSGSDDGVIKIWRTDIHEHLNDIWLPPVENEEDQPANRGILSIAVEFERSWCVLLAHPAS